MASFLALPREIRDRIYHLLLGKNTGTSHALDLRDKLSLHYIPRLSYTREPFDGSNQPTKWLFPSQTLNNIGSVAILRTCKRIAEEGAVVLYGSSTINCIPGHAFHANFLPKIGSLNSSCIRSIHLWLDAFFTSDIVHLTNTRFEQRLHDTTTFLVNLLSQKLNQLQDILLGIPAASCHRCNLQAGLPSSKIWWFRAHCAMLWFSAWITARHPRSKRAVWSQKLVNRYTPENVEDLQHLEISVRITAPFTKWSNPKCEDSEGLANWIYQGIFKNGFPAQSIKGILINSRAIRRQGLGGLHVDHNPLSFIVDEVAQTSEVGEAETLLEDISDRFGYKQSEQDNATGRHWGDLEGLHVSRLVSKK